MEMPKRRAWEMGHTESKIMMDQSSQGAGRRRASMDFPWRRYLPPSTGSWLRIGVKGPLPNCWEAINSALPFGSEARGFSRACLTGWT